MLHLFLLIFDRITGTAVVGAHHAIGTRMPGRIPMLLAGRKQLLHSNFRRNFLSLDGIFPCKDGLFLVEDAINKVLVFLIVSPNP